MFWRFGGYANISTIDTLLEKADFTLENLLDEGELLHEIKQHNAKLIEYLRDEPVLEQLLHYVVAPKLEPVLASEKDDASDNEKAPSTPFPFTRSRASSRAMSDVGDDDGEKKRNRYAYVASEVLASDTWSIYEALMENGGLIRNFWQFLKRPSPLDPLQASYFTKVNEALFEKKTEEMIELLKSFPNAVSDLLSHVECPMIMDLLLKVIALDRTEGGHGIVEWLYSQDVVPILLSCLSPDRNWVVQTAAGDFIKAIITISANASQNEQQCIGPNELTRQLVSRPCVQQLIKYMLTGGNPLTVGVGIVIEVIRKNNSDYDPDVGADEGSTPSCRDPIYLGTLLRLFADHVPDFMNLIMNAPAQKKHMSSTFGEKLQPLGFDRFKTCELMAELLHCSNMGLMNEVGSEELIAARDIERQRLRGEGKLIPRREDEASTSADELTMRFSHNTAHSDSRRLEVTNNAEDDGFEEVEHSREMNEDTSHEFVKAEEEIPPPVPIPSFFDKDDDELVDEPLSSPRLLIKDDGDIESPQFDDPDLIVAPLSPRKKTADSIDSTPAVTSAAEKKDITEKTETAESQNEKIAQEDKVDARTAPTIDTTASAQDDASDSSVVLTPATTTANESLPDQDSREAPTPEISETDVTPATKDEPEASNKSDAPAKLEAPEPPQAAVASIRDDDDSSKSSSDEETKSDDEPLPAAPAPPTSSSGPPVKSKMVAEKEEGDDEADQAEAGVESIIIRAVPDPPFEAQRSSIQPVVGDYLKMQFVEHRVVPTILTFFFKYPWNNFLHNVVYDVVQQVFNGPMDRGYNPTLAVSLFEAADVTTAIIRGQVISDESQAKTRTRMGYMGHLTLIAEEVVKFTERHPPEILSETVLERVMSPDWVNYVEGSLAETRERDNAILGGVRPEVAMSNRAAAMSGLSGVGLSGLGGSMGLGNSLQSGGSNALAEAGLNGSLDLNSDNGGNGIGPFAISAGTMMSGFGSSSDEEEDETEDTEEDINNEFRSYTDPLNNNGSSLNPPSIPPPPPPPPPLNIPPSRARLQLAARLKMHQQQQAAATAAASAAMDSEDAGQQNGDSERDNDGSAHSEPAVPAPLRNPFGDDADEVDSDEDDHDADMGWGRSERGGWWRSVVAREVGNDRDTNDSDEVDEEEDEEFGDFAMAEVDSKPGPTVVRPLAVHPPSSGIGQKSAFGGLWPFTNSSFGNSKADDAEGEVGKSDDAETGESKPADGPTEETTKGPETISTAVPDPQVSNNCSNSNSANNSNGNNNNNTTTEAKKRTTLDDTDDEVVV